MKGSFDTDPFRLLKVSDFFPVNEAERLITYAVDKKKASTKNELPPLYQILETVEPGTEFIGSISVLSSPGKSSGIVNPLSLVEIGRALNSFYTSEKEREDRELENIDVSPAKLVAKEGSIPLRIGRHSGAECVTIDGHRNIKIMQGRDNPAKYLDHATTVWLAAGAKKPTTNQGLQPFGWVNFEQLPGEEGERLHNEAARKKAFIMEELLGKIAARKKLEEEIRLKQAEQQQKDEETAAQLVREAAEKKEAEEREGQALAAMSEAERSAYIIQKIDTPDDEIGKMYKKLDEFNPEDQIIIASALKNCWESTGKWARSQCSSAQWDRVKKVKGILITESLSDTFTPEEQAAIEQIDKLADWGAWTNAGISMDSLPLPALKKLKEKFAAWKIKNGKGDKPAVWKTLNRLIRQG